MSESELERKATDIVLRRLNFAPRTRWELTQTLSEKEIPESTANRVLDRISELGYINDAEFAENWVRARLRIRGHAPVILRRELAAKGISRNLIEAALDQVTEQALRDRGVELAHKKLRSLNGFSELIARQRIISHLQRKGYPFSLAASITSEVIDATSPTVESTTI